MNVLFLQDYNFLTNQGGGAELSDGLIFAYGLETGHSIQLITPQNSNYGDINQYDLVVVSNATQFKEEVLLDVMSKAKKVLFYDHDYWTVCKWRLYKNNRENCKTYCPRLPFARKFYEHVDGIVWLSPKHRESTLFSMPELESKKYLLMPSPIDITEYDDSIHPELKEIKRVENTVIASNVLPFKGAENLLKYTQQHRNYKFTLIGAEPDPNLNFPSNVSYVGRVNHKDMPRLLKSFQYSILLPGTIAPFERYVVESILSGCTPIVNENVGCMSYDWMYKTNTDGTLNLEKIKKEVFTSPKKFWRFAESL